jgi:hypothetical protein
VDRCRAGRLIVRGQNARVGVLQDLAHFAASLTDCILGLD